MGSMGWNLGNWEDGVESRLVGGGMNSKVGKGCHEIRDFQGGIKLFHATIRQLASLYRESKVYRDDKAYLSMALSPSLTS